MKKTKAAVNFRSSGRVGHRCHDCKHIELHGEKLATCALVQGTVKRNDVCDLFAKKAKR